MEAVELNVTLYLHPDALDALVREDKRVADGKGLLGIINAAVLLKAADCKYAELRRALIPEGITEQNFQTTREIVLAISASINSLIDDWKRPTSEALRKLDKSTACRKGTVRSDRTSHAASPAGGALQPSTGN